MRIFFSLATVFAVAVIVSLGVPSAQAATVTTTIYVNSSSIFVDCVGTTGPVCSGFTGGGAPIASSEGTLSPDSADLYKVANDPPAEAAALDMLIDGVAGNDFATGVQTGTGGAAEVTFYSTAAYLALRVGGGVHLPGTHFFLALMSPGLVQVIFDKDGQRAGGLSHYTEFGTNTNVIPVPAGLVLFLSGLAGIGVLGRYKAKRGEVPTG